MNHTLDGHARHRLAAMGVLIAAAVLLIGDRGRADDAPSATQPAPIVQGQRIFTCGHSFHVFVYGLLDELAKSAGIADQEMVGISRIGGSRVVQHWDVPDEKNEAKRALTAGKVDVLTLSPIWLPDAGIENFAKLAVEHNPKVRVLVQEFWLPNDTYEPKYPLDTRKKVDHDATDLAALRKSNAAYCDDIEKHVRELNQELGKVALFVVPVGEASIALREKIVAGQAPGLKAQWDLFRDTWGHAKTPLMALSGYCHFAVIYRRSPVGLAVPAILKNDKTIADADKEPLNRLLQEIAWETVRNHKLTGVGP
jgi:hypothetical protein